VSGLCSLGCLGVLGFAALPGGGGSLGGLTALLFFGAIPTGLGVMVFPWRRRLRGGSR